MTKDFFTKQIERIVIEFGDKGFTMSKEKAAQWFEFFKGIKETNFADAITTLLNNCDKCPSMATLTNILTGNGGIKTDHYRRVD